MPDNQGAQIPTPDQVVFHAGDQLLQNAQEHGVSGYKGRFHYQMHGGQRNVVTFQFNANTPDAAANHFASSFQLFLEAHGIKTDGRAPKIGATERDYIGEPRMYVEIDVINEANATKAAELMRNLFEAGDVGLPPDRLATAAQTKRPALVQTVDEAGAFLRDIRSNDPNVKQAAIERSLALGEEYTAFRNQESTKSANAGKGTERAGGRVVGASATENHPKTTNELLIDRGGQAIDKLINAIEKKDLAAADKFRQAILENPGETPRDAFRRFATDYTSPGELANTVEIVHKFAMDVEQGRGKNAVEIILSSPRPAEAFTNAVNMAGMSFNEEVIHQGGGLKGTDEQRAKEYWKKHPRVATADIDPYAPAVEAPSEGQSKPQTAPTPPRQFQGKVPVEVALADGTHAQSKANIKIAEVNGTLRYNIETADPTNPARQGDIIDIMRRMKNAKVDPAKARGAFARDIGGVAQSVGGTMTPEALQQHPELRQFLSENVSSIRATNPEIGRMLDTLGITDPAAAPSHQGGHTASSPRTVERLAFDMTPEGIAKADQVFEELGKAGIKSEVGRKLIDGEMKLIVKVQPESMPRFELRETIQQKANAGEIAQTPVKKGTVTGVTLGFTGDANELKALAEQFKAQNIEAKLETAKDGPLLRIRSGSTDAVKSLLPPDLDTGKLPVKLAANVAPAPQFRPGGGLGGVGHGNNGGLYVDGEEVVKGTLNKTPSSPTTERTTSPAPEADVIARVQELRQLPTAELAKGKVVILVDDSPFEVVKNKGLLNNMGVEVISVGDVTEVAEAAERIPPGKKLAAIITDNELPSEENAGLKLRSDVKAGKVPGIAESTPVALSSGGLTESRADLQLSKPFDAKAFKLTVDTLLIQSQLEAEGFDVAKATQELGKGKSLMDVVEGGMSPEDLRQYKTNRLASLEKQIEFARQFASDPKDPRGGRAYIESDGEYTKNLKNQAEWKARLEVLETQYSELKTELSGESPKTQPEVMKPSAKPTKIVPGAAPGYDGGLYDPKTGELLVEGTLEQTRQRLARDTPAATPVQEPTATSTEKTPTQAEPVKVAAEPPPTEPAKPAAKPGIGEKLHAAVAKGDGALRLGTAAHGLQQLRHGLEEGDIVQTGLGAATTGTSFSQSGTTMLTVAGAGEVYNVYLTVKSGAPTEVVIAEASGGAAQLGLLAKAAPVAIIAGDSPRQLVKGVVHDINHVVDFVNGDITLQEFGSRVADTSLETGKNVVMALPPVKLVTDSKAIIDNLQAIAQIDRDEAERWQPKIPEVTPGEKPKLEQYPNLQSAVILLKRQGLVSDKDLKDPKKLLQIVYDQRDLNSQLARHKEAPSDSMLGMYAEDIRRLTNDPHQNDKEDMDLNELRSNARIFRAAATELRDGYMPAFEAYEKAERAKASALRTDVFEHATSLMAALLAHETGNMPEKYKRDAALATAALPPTALAGFHGGSTEEIMQAIDTAMRSANVPLKPIDPADKQQWIEDRAALLGVDVTAFGFARARDESQNKAALTSLLTEARGAGTLQIGERSDPRELRVRESVVILTGDKLPELEEALRKMGIPFRDNAPPGFPSAKTELIVPAQALEQFMPEGVPRPVTPQSLDRDGDGRISGRDFDTNGDGKIDQNEAKGVQDAFAALKNSLDPAALKAIAQIRGVAAANNVKLDEGVTSNGFEVGSGLSQGQTRKSTTVTPGGL